jgi:23S rRNA (cytidine2498-2'-O)-methyltransferase
MHWLFTDEGSERFLLDELKRNYPRAHHAQDQERWVTTDAPLDCESERTLLAFCRQAMLRGEATTAASINLWAERVASAVIDQIPAEQPWRLHLWPAYGEGRAGINRCALIREAVMERLKKRRRALVRTLEEGSAPFTAQTSLVQLALRAPEEGILSVTLGPLPWGQRTIVSAFPEGWVPIAEDKSAPSRAFTKLVEAEQRMGKAIRKGQSCVDLGACPGGWSYVVLARGARVVAVDRSELRTDLMTHPKLHFHCGDAFKFRHDVRVDWLLCDVIAAPQRSIDLLVAWLQEERMVNFIVSIKFMGVEDYPLIDQLKARAAPLCSELSLIRLSANKNEICAFGSAI